VITVDLQIMGQRHKDLKNGLSAPPKLTPASILNLATKIPWGLEMLQTQRRFFGNIVGHAEGVSDPASLGSWTAEAFDPSLNWERIKEFRSWWDGPVILKGILDEEDAKMAANVGADAIVVSNHGGRQLDGALSSIRMLPRIMDAVGDKIEVHLDSGIRSGQDVLKALALGAKGTMIGRAFVYGLGAMGQAGVTKALEVIHKELDTTMALCGERDVANLGRHNLLLPPDFERAGPEDQPAARRMRGSSKSGTAHDAERREAEGRAQSETVPDEAQKWRADHEAHIAQQHRAADRERPTPTGRPPAPPAQGPAARPPTRRAPRGRTRHRPQGAPARRRPATAPAPESQARSRARRCSFPREVTRCPSSRPIPMVRPSIAGPNAPSAAPPPSVRSICRAAQISTSSPRRRRPARPHQQSHAVQPNSGACTEDRPFFHGRPHRRCATRIRTEPGSQRQGTAKNQRAGATSASREKPVSIALPA
jgi:hypothetical protein